MSTESTEKKSDDKGKLTLSFEGLSITAKPSEVKGTIDEVISDLESYSRIMIAGFKTNLVEHRKAIKEAKT